MAKRQMQWCLAAGVIFLAGCDNDAPFLPPPPPTPPPPVTTNSYIVTSANRLLGVNLATPGTIAVSNSITGLAAGETIADISFRPNDGLLYGLVVGAAGAGRIVTISPTTGALTAVSTLVADPTDTTAPYTALSGARFGIDFNPVPDRLRVVSNTGQSLRINVANGATITDTALNGAATGATGAAYTNAFNAACRTQLFVIDPATDRVYLQNPPNDGVLNSIGALGVDATSVNGFTISTSATGANTAFAVLTTAASTGVYSINTGTGAATLASTLTLNAGESAIGFATRAQTATPAQAAGELFGLTNANGYVTFMRGSPNKLCTSGAVTGLPTGVDLLGLDTRPVTGGLVALASNSSLFTVTTAGVAAPLCPLAADPTDTTLPFSALTAGANFGVGFNPVPDRLRVTGSDGSNLRINTTPAASGACLVITDTTISSPAGTVATGAAYTNAIPTANVTTLYAIDSGNDALVRIGANPANGTVNDPGNPNSGVAVAIGSLGIGDITAVNGFVIDGRNNNALLAAVAGTATGSSVYNVNLTTGAATSAGTVGGGAGTAAAPPLRGLAPTGGTTLNVYAVTTDNRLVSFSQANNLFTPNAVADVAITGLSAGEQVVGIDFRPANGLLYGVSSLNRIYTINTSTGLATLASTLVADSTDLTVPFTALPAGANFGADFNPVVDRLRVISSTAANLRINVANGATITDTDLTATNLVGAAYTNNFAGTTATQLFDVDATTLYLQNPPNDGVVTAVGPLGVTANGDVGFDITGGANGLVLAAIRTGAGTGPSDLYRINLTTGAATLVNAGAGASRIGLTTTQQIRSIAIDVR